MSAVARHPCATSACLAVYRMEGPMCKTAISCRIATLLVTLLTATSLAADPQGRTVNRAGAATSKRPESTTLTKAVVSLKSASSAVPSGSAGIAGRLKTFPEQNKRSNRNWGRVLTDVARHLPAGADYDSAFRRFTESYDLVTAGHEWTHYLNAYLSGNESSAYYLLDDKYMTLADPQGLRGKVPHVPRSLRGILYKLYLEQNSGSARVCPLYLFDEWTAYANDVTIALDQLAEGKPLNPFSPKATQPYTAGNVLEFTFYGCAVGLAVKKHDPQYYAGEAGQKLREFIAFNAKRSLEVYKKALRHEELNQGDSRNPKLLDNFRRSADAAELRAWVKSDLDQELAAALLGVEESARF